MPFLFKDRVSLCRAEIVTVKMRHEIKIFTNRAYMPVRMFAEGSKADRQFPAGKADLYERVL